jgi:hypothetical protein
VICEFGHRLTKLMAKKEEDNKERLAKVVFLKAKRECAVCGVPAQLTSCRRIGTDEERV